MMFGVFAALSCFIFACSDDSNGDDATPPVADADVSTGADATPPVADADVSTGAADVSTGDVDVSTGEADVTTGAADVSTGDAATPLPSTEITYDIQLREWISGQPLEGTEICFNTEAADCVAADAKGKASVTGLVPAGEPLQVRGDKDGYFPLFFDVDPAVHNAIGTTPVTWTMLSNTGIGQLVSSLGTLVDDTKGQIMVSVSIDSSTGAAGAVISTTATFELGPNYFNPYSAFANGFFVADATATNHTGSATFFNVDPGEVALTVELEGHICRPGISGVVTETATSTSLVEAGRVTYFTIWCDVDSDAPPPEGVEGTHHVQINEWLAGTPVEGVTLCTTVADADCAVTDADGLASMTGTYVPGEVIQLRADKEGYFPFLTEGVVPDVPEFSDEPAIWVMAEAPIVDFLMQMLGTTVDDAKGHITVTVTTLDEDGVPMPLLGALVSTDAVAETGPDYFTPAGTLATVPGITETGGAIFFNVDVGLAEFTVEMEGYTCGPAASGLAGVTGDVGITVEAGRVSYVGARCTAD